VLHLVLACTPAQFQVLCLSPVPHCPAHHRPLLLPPQLLLELAAAADVRGKIDAMFSGARINSTEGRAVLHAALRAPRDAVMEEAGKNVVPEVWAVLDKIKAFTGGWGRWGGMFDWVVQLDGWAAWWDRG
jgi:hypothetical protein